ncbi:MAG TPA: ParB/RepB/Spo0J family partition protein [Armatimonadota bacterium]|nr:ParB/RepB/Spo0J family partition protein [Armatimonadota bacterium]
MAKRPAFDFKLGQTPRVREKQAWMEVASDTRALGAAGLENARLLLLDHVEAGPWQVRRNFRPGKMAELVESVRSQGVLEPILVQATPEGKYYIIAGERRYRAAREVGLTTIPAVVLEIDDLNARIIALMENIQRDDLNEIERAEGLVLLKQVTGQTWEEIGGTLGVSKRHVLHMVSLTHLPQPVQDLVRAGKLSAKHGRLIAYVKDPQLQVALAEFISDKHLNAQKTAALVKQIGSGVPDAESMAALPEAVQERLETLLAQQPAGEKKALPVSAKQLIETAAALRREIAAFQLEATDEVDGKALLGELDALATAAGVLRWRLKAAAAAHKSE